MSFTFTSFANKSAYIRKHLGIIMITFVVMNKTNGQDLPTKMIQVTGGYSKHGSGDMNGIVFGTEYTTYRSKKISLNYYFRAGINNSVHAILVNNPGGSWDDRSIRFTTAGVQLGVNGRFSFIRNRQSEILVSLGPFVRYQSASNGSDGYSIYGPTVTGLPTVLVEYNNRSPQKTYAVGGLLQLQYHYTTKRNFVIGIAPGIQTDSNGDTMPQVVLMVGKRFR